MGWDRASGTGRKFEDKVMGKKSISGKYSDEDLSTLVLVDCDAVRKTIRSSYTIQEAERTLCRGNGWTHKMFPPKRMFAPKRAVEEVASKLGLDFSPCFPDLSTSIPADAIVTGVEAQTGTVDTVSLLAEAINHLADAINNFKKEWRITIS